MRALSAIFDGVVDTLEGRAPPPEKIQHSAEDAAAAFQTALCDTILIRRITVRAENGSRLSVIAKNKRVLKVAEVHPAEMWQHSEGFLETACTSDYDGFGLPFASALVKVTGKGPVQIEQALVSDPLGSTARGYPASKLVADVEKSQQRIPAGDEVQKVYDAFDTCARARFGATTAVDIPAGYTVTEDWLQQQVAATIQSVAGRETDVKFAVLSGDTPRALASVWLDGEGAIIVSEDAASFDAIAARLESLRGHL